MAAVSAPNEYHLPSPAEISSAKKTRSSQDEATENHHGMMSFIEREWAMAAARNAADNAFAAYMAALPRQLFVPPLQQQQQQVPRLPPQPSQQRQMMSPLLQQGDDLHQQHPIIEQLQPPQQLSAPMQAAQLQDTELPSLSRSQRNKIEAKQLIARVNAVALEDGDKIFDSCAQVAEKINRFLQLNGVNKGIFLEHALNCKNHYSMLKAFLAEANQSQRSSKIYQRAYVFFEKLRLHEGHKKSEERLQNEAERENGFSTDLADVETVCSESEGSYHEDSQNEI